jgi:site-specific DNA-methyltransferase (adenine-specific)
MKEQHWSGRSNISIYQMDCLEAMKEMEDNAFDLAIVDPPYGIDFGEFNRTNKSSDGTRYKSNKYKNSNWDEGIPNDEYFNELMRVSRDQIVWGGNYFPYLWRSGCKGFVFWYKGNPVPNFSDGELAWTSFNKVAKQIDYRYYGNIEGNSSASSKIHPTQKPVKLYEWLLMNYATCKTCKNEGGCHEDVAGDGGSRMWQPCEACNGKKPKILDTHLGSGSHAIACWNLNFDLTAFELDADYFKATTRRIEKHTRQIQMF